MSEYKLRMEEPAFKEHFSEQLEMFDYFKYLLKKQKREQDYLQKQVHGKVKDLELRTRAVKLRNMVTRQQKVLKDIRVRRKHEESNNEYEASNHNPTNDGRQSPVHKKFHKKGTTSEKQNTNTRFIGLHAPTTDVSMNPSNYVSQELPPTTSSNQRQQPHCNSQQNQAESFQQLVYLLQRSQQQQQQEKSQKPHQQQQQNQQPQHSRQQQKHSKTTSTMQQQQKQQQSSSSSLSTTQQQEQQLTQVLNSASLEKSLQFFQQSLQGQQIAALSDTSDLQRLISKQILVHLQVLQKHVLTQLVNVMQDKTQNITDFGKVLPVLQQLQQLQQSILDQQSDGQQLGGSSDDGNGSQTAHAVSTQQDVLGMCLSRLASTSQQQLQQQQQTQQTQQQLQHQQHQQLQQQLQQAFVMATGNRVASTTMEDQSESDRMFDQSCLKELDVIKRAFSYSNTFNDVDDGKDGKDESNNDCFPNVSSPDLQALLSETNINSNQSGDGDKTEDDDSKKDNKKLTEEETLNYSQPFLQNQQQLLQLQHVC